MSGKDQPRRGVHSLLRALEDCLEAIEQGQQPGAWLQLTWSLRADPAGCDLVARHCHGPSGFTLPTALAYGAVAPVSWGPASRLADLAFLGVNPNVPDAHGRIASLQAMDTQAYNLLPDDIRRALHLGASPLVVEQSSKARRSWLTLDFGESMGRSRDDTFWHGIHHALETALGNLALEHPDRLAATIADMDATPVLPVHQAWWANIKAKWLLRCLPGDATGPGPRRRL